MSYNMLQLHALVNDPDTGGFTGKATAFDIWTVKGEQLISLVDTYMDRGVKFDCGNYDDLECDESYIKVDEMKFKHYGCSSGGNWCWRVFLVRKEVGARILNYLKKIGDWDSEMGVENLDEKWNDGTEFVQEDFE